MKGINADYVKPTSDVDGELKSIKQCGFKYIRITLKCFIDDKVALLGFLNIAYKYGLGVVLTMPNKKCWPDTDYKYSSDEIRSLWVQLLSIGDHPATVGYELCNEPKIPDWPIVQNELISLVRKHTDKPIIVSTTGMAFDFTEPLNGSNLWYSHHDYNPLQYTHQGIGKHPPTDDAYPGVEGWSSVLEKRHTWDTDGIREHLAPIREFQLRHGVNIFLGEFSCTNDAINGDEWIKDFMEVYNEYNFHWFYYNWFAQDSTFDKWKPNENRMNILQSGL